MRFRRAAHPTPGGAHTERMALLHRDTLGD